MMCTSAEIPIALSKLLVRKEGLNNKQVEQPRGLLPTPLSWESRSLPLLLPKDESVQGLSGAPSSMTAALSDPPSPGRLRCGPCPPPRLPDW